MASIEIRGAYFILLWTRQSDPHTFTLGPPGQDAYVLTKTNENSVRNINKKITQGLFKDDIRTFFIYTSMMFTSS